MAKHPFPASCPGKKRALQKPLAVDLAAGEDKAAVFAQRDDLVHRLFGVFHGEFLLSTFGSGDKKRPEPIKVGSGRTNHCPWFHLNSPLDAGHFVPL